ncbi:hypothetical protein GCM10027421_20330 [Microbacterium shaanxiense]
MPDERMSGHEARQRMTWGAGIAIGMGVGVALGAALDDMGRGITLGIAIGVAFAVVMAMVGRRADAAREHAVDDGAQPDIEGDAPDEEPGSAG